MILHSRVKIGDNRELQVLGQAKVIVAREISIKNVLVIESLGYNLGLIAYVPYLPQFYLSVPPMCSFSHLCHGWATNGRTQP